MPKRGFAHSHILGWLRTSQRCAATLEKAKVTDRHRTLKEAIRDLHMLASVTQAALVVNYAQRSIGAKRYSALTSAHLCSILGYSRNPTDGRGCGPPT
jgi:hypothetical protein